MKRNSCFLAALLCCVTFIQASSLGAAPFCCSCPTLDACYDPIDPYPVDEEAECASTCEVYDVGAEDTEALPGDCSEYCPFNSSLVDCDSSGLPLLINGIDQRAMIVDSNTNGYPDSYDSYFSLDTVAGHLCVRGYPREGSPPLRELGRSFPALESAAGTVLEFALPSSPPSTVALEMVGHQSFVPEIGDNRLGKTIQVINTDGLPQVAEDEGPTARSRACGIQGGFAFQLVQNDGPDVLVDFDPVSCDGSGCQPDTDSPNFLRFPLPLESTDDESKVVRQVFVPMGTSNGSPSVEIAFPDGTGGPSLRFELEEVPACVPRSAAPTMTEWGLIVGLAVLLCVGAWGLGRFQGFQALPRP